MACCCEYPSIAHLSLSKCDQLQHTCICCFKAAGSAAWEVVECALSGGEGQEEGARGEGFGG